MFQQNKKKMVLLLVLVAVILLLFGIYMLLNLFFPDTFNTSNGLNLPKKGTSLSVNSKKKPVVLEAKTVLKTVTTTKDIEASKKKQLLQDVINTATDVVARIGSGSNQDGFRGFSDVLLNVDSVYKKVLLDRQKKMLKKYPVEKGFLEMRTKVLIWRVVSGSVDSDLITISIQTQYTEDTGDISNPTLVQYKKYLVSMKKQDSGNYLVSNIEESVLDR